MSLRDFSFGQKYSGRLIVSVIAAVLLPVIAHAQSQTAARPDRGVSAISSYSLSDIENINLSNGNVNLSIPLASLPPVAGGKLSAGFRAVYNSKRWDVILSDTTPNPVIPAYTDHTVASSDVASWTIGSGYRLNDVSRLGDYDNTNSLDPNDQQQMLNAGFVHKMVLTGPDGSKHEFRPIGLSSGTLPWAFGYYLTTPKSEGSSLAYYSFDGSYLWATIDSYTGDQPTSWRVYMLDGTNISFNNGVQKIRDPNGNRIDIWDELNGSITTTHIQVYQGGYQAGRELKYVFTAGQPGHGQIQYYTFGGVQQNIEVNFDQVSVHGHVYPNGLTCPDVRQKELNTQLTVIRSIVLPQSQPGVNLQYGFAYNCETNDTANVPLAPPDCNNPGPFPPLTNPSHGWGSLSHMTLPSGATVDYTYSLDGIYTVTDVNDASREGVTQKKVTHDGGVQDIWTYTKGTTAATMQGSDGASIREDVYLHDDAYAGFFGGSEGRSGLTYRTTRSGAAGTISVVERHWSSLIFDNAYTGVPGGGMVAQFNPVVDAEYTTLYDNSNPPVAVKMSAKTFQYDFNGSVNSENDYDWFDPALVSRDPQNVPMGVPSTVTATRVITHSFYNAATTSGSSNAYSMRNLNTAVPLILNAPLETSVSDGAGNQLSRSQFLYDGSSSTNTPPTSGNLTTEKHRLIQETRWITTTHQYDSYGNLTQTTDPPPNNSVTTLAYSDSTNALPTSVTVDPRNNTGSQTATTVYDYWTGAVISITDANNKTTTTSYTNQLLNAVDPFVRPGVVTDPQNRNVVTRYYDNTPQQIVVWSDLNTQNDALLKSRTTRDQLGRVIKTESTEDGANYTISADSAYEQAGRIVYTSNPHGSSSSTTDGWTRATHDEIGRVVEIATFDGATKPSASATNWNGRVQTSYNAEQTTVTDQAGKMRRSVLDGLSRLHQVIEDSNGLNYLTSYSYDALDNLLTVNQGSQPNRTFTYDSLKRLVSAYNPENGTINYTYYDDGNLHTKTDAASVVTTYVYDGLNRVTSRTYSGPGSNGSGGTTPAVTWVYDTLGISANGKGRLTSVSSSVSSYSYGSYDAMGRALSSTQTTDSQPYTFQYQYNLAGEMTSETYPSGREVDTEYDSAGRVSGVKHDGTGLYYAGKSAASGGFGFRYAATGAVTTMPLGNGRLEQTSYNGRLQPSQIKLDSNTSGVNTLQLDYGYSATGANNGNVMSQTITVPNGSGGTIAMSQSYSYDALNRLTSAMENNGSAWTQNYDYDRWGNRAVRNTSYIPHPRQTVISTSSDLSTLFNQSTNQINASSDYHYDGAGNLDRQPNIASGFDQMTYDGENHLLTYAGSVGQYFYDGDGRRVKKIDSTGTTVFVYNAGGQLIAEYTSGTPAAGETSYLTTDHLGSTRLVTDSGGNVKARYDYLPFGDEISSSVGGRSSVAGYGGADATRQKFTQKERDSESGLDYFGARYYSSAQGRFTSTDPIFTTLKRLVDPQRLDQYAYVRNSPLRFTDEDGMDLTIDAKNEDEARKAFEYLQKGLRKQDRSHVHLVVGDGKNGFAKGVFGVTVDDQYVSKSQNFQHLKGIIQDTDQTARLKLVGPSESLPIVSLDKVGDKTVITPVEGVTLTRKMVQGLILVGWTTFPLVGPLGDTPSSGGYPNYNQTGSIRSYVANDQKDVEIVVTIHHELNAHVFLSNMGRDIPRGYEDRPEVKRESKRAEREARSNFNQR